jgi:hypothetical protein
VPEGLSAASKRRKTRAISGPHLLFSAIARQRFEIKRAADEDLAGDAEDPFFLAVDDVAKEAAFAGDDHEAFPVGTC